MVDVADQDLLPGSDRLEGAQAHEAVVVDCRFSVRCTGVVGVCGFDARWYRRRDSSATRGGRLSHEKPLGKAVKIVSG